MNRLLALGSFPALVMALVIGAAVALVVDGATLSAQLTPLPTAVRVTGDLPDIEIETASGARTTFSATDGQVRVATLFYTHCPGVCPLTIDKLQQIAEQLPLEQRAKLNFVLLSLDPARDDPTQLRALAAERALPASHWLIGRASPAATAAFAKAVHLDYRALSDGSIDHSSSLVLLNERGRVLARATAESDLTGFVTAVQQAVRE
jgi:protein SCO1